VLIFETWLIAYPKGTNSIKPRITHIQEAFIAKGKSTLSPQNKRIARTHGNKEAAELLPD